MLLLFKGLFGKIFSDWRLIAMAGLVALCAVMTVKLKVEQSHLATAQQTIKIVETNNIVLKQNIATITKVNQENLLMIEQLRADTVITGKTVAQLNNQLAGQTKTVAILKKKLADITTPPQKLSPHIAVTVQGIQELRDQAEADAAAGDTK
jgi:hypothetical protein